MKTFVKLISMALTTAIAAGFVPSCSHNSGKTEAIKPLLLYVGYRNNSTASRYAEYTDDDLQKLFDIGVTEVCINCGNAPAAYIPDGEP